MRRRLAAMETAGAVLDASTVSPTSDCGLPIVD
jgi:hypothetical protein